jgi:hypothetical protein
MNRIPLVCPFLCLAATLSFSQSSPVSLIDPGARFLSPVSAVSAAAQADPETQARIQNSYGTLPLSFEMNQGQTDARVKFLSRTGEYSLFLTGDEAVLALRRKKSNRDASRQEPASLSVSNGNVKLGSKHIVKAPPIPQSVRGPGGSRGDTTAENMTYPVLRMKLHNADAHAVVTGIDELAGKNNYFIGNDRAKWHADVPTYAKVKYEGIYSGIDLVYYGNQRQLEYDFIVAPGANPRSIAFDVGGANRIRRDAHGDLIFKMGEDQIRWHKPVVYQERDGARQVVAANYAVTNYNRVRFEIAKYDVSRPLYIDPLIYSTYLGGSDYESGRAIAVDGAGNAYVTGKTYSTDFPVTSGAFQTTRKGDDDVFVTKFNSAGSALVYSTYLGGSGYADDGGDIAGGIAVDSSGNAYLTGTTYSSDFPTTAGAFQTVCGGGGNCGVGDGFVTKLNPTGSALVYSSYLGGSSYNFAEGIAVDSSGSAYITGGTDSTDFPITPDAFQTTFGGCFVTKFNPTGSALVYSTYLGGSGGAPGGDHGYGIAVDSSGNAYVTGLAGSSDFPTTPGAFQSVCNGGDTSCAPPNTFVTKFNPSASGLVYSALLGGSDIDWGMGIAVDRSGNAYVTGTTYSRDFPTTSGGFQTTCGGAGNNYSGCWDAFVTKVNPDGSALAYSNYLGGTNDDWGIDISVDSSGNAYVIGYTESSDFPMKYPLQPANLAGTSAFVTKISPEGALTYSTYLGGIGGIFDDYEGIYYMVEPVLGIAPDSSGNAYVTGQTGSYNFPTMSPLQPFLGGPGDAFVAKISAEPSEITLSPLHLDFGRQPTGVVSSPQVSVLNNTGSASLAISSISVTGTNSGDFAQTNDCGTSLPPGMNCSITATFTPAAVGNRSAAVKIVDSAPKQWISLTGIGMLFTVTKFTSNVNPSALGKPVTFKATVSSPAGGTPTGVIDVSGNGIFVSKTLKGGTMSFTTAKLPLGLNAFTVHYSGDATYGYSDTSLNQYVLEASTTTTLTSSPNPSAYGQAVAFTAIVTPSTGAPPPDGEVVSFMEGKTVLGTGALTNGSASFATAALAVAKDTVSAVYGGDSNFVGSASKILDQVVNKATTTTTLVSSQNPSSVGQSVTFTAHVTPQFSGTVKGSITFYDGTTKLATAPLNGATAKLTTSKLTVGSHTISATFEGNTSFTSSSGSLTQTVN